MDRIHVFAAVTAISLGVLAPLATSAGAESPPGSSSVDATCAGATVTTSGWPDGTLVMFGLGAAPPGGLTVNGTMFWSADLTELSAWMLQVTPPDQPSVLIGGRVDCAVPATEIAAEPELVPEVGAVPVPIVERTAAIVGSPWKGLELAPPW